MTKLYLYLIDDLAIVREVLDSYYIANILVKKGFIHQIDTQSNDFKVYYKRDSLAVMCVKELEEEYLHKLYDKLIFLPNQENKYFNRIVRVGSNSTPIFTDIISNELIRFSHNESIKVLKFDEKDIEETSIVTGKQAYEEIYQLIKR